MMTDFKYVDAAKSVIVYDHIRNAGFKVLTHLNIRHENGALVVLLHRCYDTVQIIIFSGLIVDIKQLDQEIPHRKADMIPNAVGTVMHLFRAEHPHSISVRAQKV